MPKKKTRRPIKEPGSITEGIGAKPAKNHHIKKDYFCMRVTDFSVRFRKTNRAMNIF